MTAILPSDLSCEEVVLLLWEYLDEELDDARRAQIRAHLADCEHCEGQATFEAAFLRSLRAVVDSPPVTRSIEGLTRGPQRGAE